MGIIIPIFDVELEFIIRKLFLMTAPDCNKHSEMMKNMLHCVEHQWQLMNYACYLQISVGEHNFNMTYCLPFGVTFN
jgi:hypothetical protein